MNRAAPTLHDPTTIPRLLATAAAPDLGSHLRQWGQLPHRPGLIDEVRRSGLVGRGGGSFPTALKLRAVARARKQAIVVANGTEGEPTSSKDKVLLTGAPHLVLDGARVAAEAVGSGQVIVCVERSARGALQSIKRALAERARAGGDGISFRVEAAPTGYLTGEESALVHWLNGGDAKPLFVPPRPFHRGVDGRPTLIGNVETLAHLALIARFGAEWFCTLGSAHDSGTALVTVAGAVRSPGVYEIALGTTLSALLLAAGATPDPAAGSRSGRDAGAVLVGGYAGRWMAPNADADTALVPANLGCGAVFALPEGACGLAETARVARWMAGQSAGQCGPCTNGLPAVAAALDGLVAGDLDGRWEAQLHRWTAMIDGRGACHHPDGAIRFVESALVAFAKDIAAHRRRGPCRPSPHQLPLPTWNGGWR